MPVQSSRLGIKNILGALCLNVGIYSRCAIWAGTANAFNLPYCVRPVSSAPSFEIISIDHIEIISTGQWGDSAAETVFISLR